MLWLLRAGAGVCQPSLYGGLEGLTGAVPVEDVRHQRETLPGQIVAQIWPGSPLAVNVRRRVDAFGAVHCAGMFVDLVCRGKLLTGTSAPVANPWPTGVDVFVDGFGGIHGWDHLDGAV